MEKLFGILGPLSVAFLFIYLGLSYLFSGKLTSRIILQYRTMHGNLPRIIGFLIFILGVSILLYILRVIHMNN